MGDGPLGYTINGKGFPATQPIAAKLGQKVLVCFLNAGQLSHPMHLHGFHFTVVARDGVPIAPYVVDTLSVGPGEIYDAVFGADSPGVWAFHCHILSHAESDHGMHGMVTAVIVGDPPGGRVRDAGSFREAGPFCPEEGGCSALLRPPTALPC